MILQLLTIMEILNLKLILIISDLILLLIILKIINIPIKNEDINLGEIRMVPYHIFEHIVIGGESPEIPEKVKEQDRKLREDVLKNYQVKIFGKKLKPNFEGSYLVFDFNQDGGK